MTATLVRDSSMIHTEPDSGRRPQDQSTKSNSSQDSSFHSFSASFNGRPGDDDWTSSLDKVEDDSRYGAELPYWDTRGVKKRVTPFARRVNSIPSLLRKKRRSLSLYHGRDRMHIDFLLALLFGETKDNQPREYWFPRFGTMPSWRPELMKNRFWREFHTILRGFGNMVWCNNPISGIFVIASMYHDHSFMATCALFGLCGSTWAGRMLCVSPTMVDSGLYSYNGLLCGFYIALLSADGPGGWEPWVLVNCYLVGSLSSVFMVAISNVLAATYHVPPMSLPYIISVMLFVGATFSSSYWPPNSQAEFPVHPDRDVDSLVKYDYKELFLAVFRGMSVAQTPLGGLGMTVAACICSPILAIAGVFGGMIGYATCVYMGVPPDDPYFYSGMYSYNGGLSAQAMLMFLVPTGGAILYTVLCCFSVSIAHIGLSNIFKPIGLLPGTLAMNIVGIGFLLTHLSVTFIIAVPLECATIPEDHILQYQRMKRLVKTLSLSLQRRNQSVQDNGEHVVPSGPYNTSNTQSIDFENLQKASLKVVRSLPDKPGTFKSDTAMNDVGIHIFIRRVSRDGSLTVSMNDLGCAVAKILDCEYIERTALAHTLEDLWRFAGKKSDSDVLTENDIRAVLNLWGVMSAEVRQMRCIFDNLDVHENGTIDYATFSTALQFFPSQVCEESKFVLQKEIYNIFEAEVARRVKGNIVGPSSKNNQKHVDLDPRRIRLTFGQFIFYLCGIETYDPSWHSLRSEAPSSPM